MKLILKAIKIRNDLRTVLLATANKEGKHHAILAEYFLVTQNSSINFGIDELNQIKDSYLEIIDLIEDLNDLEIHKRN